MPASASPRGAENRTRRRPARPPRAGSTPPDPAAADSEPQAADAATQPDYRVEALAKGLRVLSVFSEQRPTWRITDIAAEVSLPLPTAYRIVMTLTAEGYLDHLPSGEYRPGVRVLTLGTAALRSLDLVELATPKLQDLANATRETVNLAVLTGDQVLYLVRLRNSDLVTANIRVGSLLPAVHTSIGKLLLAFLDEDELARCVTNESFDGTTGPNAKRSLDELRPELASIRGQGWAMQDEELAYGLRSVAAPVHGENGAVVAGANLAVLSGDRVLYLVRLRNSDLVTANIQVGSTLPAVHTSIGKLLLSYLDEADLAARITDASFSANAGPNAKVSLAELRGELRTARDQGWAMQDEELAHGLRSVAAPITGPDGRVLAGVNLAVQARDWSSQRIVRELRPAVLAACAEISGLLTDC